MKIIFYNHTGKVSGAERMLLLILERLDRVSYEPVLVCPAEGQLQGLAAELGVPVKTVEPIEARFTLRPGLLIRYLISLAGAIRELRHTFAGLESTIIHANSIRAGLIATIATFGRRVRIVWHLHDLLPRHPLSTAIRCFATLSVQTRMIAVSEAVARNFRGMWPLRKRVTVILNAIDIARFQAEFRLQSQLRPNLRLNDDDFIVGIVGQITPRKGQLGLLQAFAEVLPRVPTAKLLIVGAPLFNRDDEYLALLQRTTTELGVDAQVRFLGSREDVPAIMRALDIVIVNSSVEPFGLVAVEGMAAGAVVVAANTGGLAEIIDHGMNGWLLPPADEKALTETMVMLAEHPDLRRQLISRAKQKAAVRFDATDYITRLGSFYSQQLAEKLASQSMPQVKEFELEHKG